MADDYRGDVIILSKIHRLKTWHDYFNAILNGNKLFECRKNDRDFKVGDTLILQEYIQEEKKYTGVELYTNVTYILKDNFPGISKGYVIMSLGPIQVDYSNHPCVKCGKEGNCDRRCPDGK